MAFLDAAGANPKQVEQIKTKLGEVKLSLRLVDQALKADDAKEEALEALKQRLAPTEPEEAPAQPEEAAAEATPENEDLEELPKAELQRKMLAQSIEPVDKFFDDTDGFLKQLLLSKQGELLRDMIVGLGKIERGDLGEDLALTDIVVVPNEPDPQPETKPDEGETASQQNEQIQEQEEPKVSANAKDRREVKSEIAAIRDLLKDVVAVAKKYQEYATSTNIDSRFDGTKLKVVFGQKLEATQERIGNLVAKIGKVMEATEQPPDTEAGEQLQEQDAQTRQEKIKLVQDTYRDLMRLYKNSFQVQAGEEFDFAKTQQAARNMINVVNDSGIVAFYPRITKFDAASGQVITLGQAYEEMTKLVKKLAKTTADIFLNIRDGEVEVNNMQRAILDLQDISSAIENYYGIKSMIRAKDVAKIDPDQLESFGYELSPGEEIDMPIDPGKDEPIPTADVEIEDDEPMTSNEFIKKYLKNTRNYNILLTQSELDDVMRLVDFLRFLKFENDNITVVEQLNPSIQGKNLSTIIEPLKKNDLLKKTLKRMNITKERKTQLFKTLEKHHKVVKNIIKNLGIELSKPQKTTEPDSAAAIFDFIDSPEAEAFFSGKKFSKKQEQLIKKLIPIVESILKD